VIVWLSESFSVNNARKFIRKFQHSIFRKIGPPRVNQFVQQNVQKFFARERLRHSDRSCGVATVPVSIRWNATTSQLPAIAPDPDRAFSARHAGNFPAMRWLV
jgi:hypothetical protein